MSSRVEASLVITSFRIAAIDFALGEPLPPDFGQQPGGIGLVEQDRAGRPAIRKGEPIELVQDARGGCGRESDDCEHAQMRVAEPRLEAAGQRLIGQQRIEIHRHLRHADTLLTWSRPWNADRSASPASSSQADFGHEALDQLEDAVGAIDESRAAIREGRRPLAHGPRRARLRCARRPRPAADRGR